MSFLSSIHETFAANPWTAKTEMPTVRYSSAVAAVNNKIYVIGGWSGGVLTTNEEYDPAIDTWAAKAKGIYRS